MDKPIKPKPHFYAVCLPRMQEIAASLGYNLIVHGSMSRDLDLVAVPWNDFPSSHYELLTQIDMAINGKQGVDYQFPDNYMFSVLPGGRQSYVVNINRGGPYNGYEDAQYYLDISITPTLAECDKLLKVSFDDLKKLHNKVALQNVLLESELMQYRKPEEI